MASSDFGALSDDCNLLASFWAFQLFLLAARRCFGMFSAQTAAVTTFGTAHCTRSRESCDPAMVG